MRKILFVVVALIIVLNVPALADLDQDKADIRQAALDYIEGWYEGDATRMERALHPDLAKRIIRTGENDRSRLDHMSALTLVQASRDGFGTRTPKEQRVREVEILDVFENIASVKIVAKDWVDYLHVGRFNDRWVIVNVLWELNPVVGYRGRE